MKFLIQLICILSLSVSSSFTINSFITTNGDNFFIKAVTVVFSITVGLWLGERLYGKFISKDDPQPPA